MIFNFAIYRHARHAAVADLSLQVAHRGSSARTISIISTINYYAVASVALDFSIGLMKN